MPYKDPAVARIASRRRQAKYRTTEKGQRSTAAYIASPVGRAVRASINASPNSRAARRRYKRTPRAVSAQIQYDKREDRKRARSAYAKTPRGRAVFAAKAQRRRAAAKGAPGGHHTAAERLAKFAEFGWVCAYCPEPATTLDHVVALANGGSNAIANCVPACRPCNSAKADKPGWVPRSP